MTSTGGGAEPRDLSVARSGAPVPGVLWQPAAGTPSPVVLIGHGGSGHKRSDRVSRVARLLVDEGLAAVAIDGPFHGERAVPGADYQQLIADEGAECVVDRMVADWLHVVDGLAAEGVIDDDAVGVLGMSMGARYGLAVAAALGERCRAVAVGKYGLEAGLPAELSTADRSVRDARALCAPALQHVQWDDEVFPRDGQLALFDEIGSADKRLLTRPGLHGDEGAQDELDWCNFLRRYL